MFSWVLEYNSPTLILLLFIKKQKKIRKKTSAKKIFFRLLDNEAEIQITQKNYQKSYFINFLREEGKIIYKIVNKHRLLRYVWHRRKHKPKPILILISPKKLFVQLSYVKPCSKPRQF